jgi:hypothetical protein
MPCFAYSNIGFLVRVSGWYTSIQAWYGWPYFDSVLPSISAICWEEDESCESTKRKVSLDISATNTVSLFIAVTSCVFLSRYCRYLCNQHTVSFFYRCYILCLFIKILCLYVQNQEDRTS